VRIAMLLGAGLGAALWLLRLALAPPRTDLAAAVGRWESARAFPTTGTTQTGVGRWRNRAGPRVGRWASRWLAVHGFTLAKVRADLQLLDETIEEHLVRKIILGVFGLLLPSVLSAVLLAGGVHPPIMLPAAGGLILAALFFVAPDLALAREATLRRAELRRALGCYLDLVSMSMAGGRGVPEALPTAAEVGEGWAFELLASTISRARYTGITPWAALGELGERTAMGELRDLGSALSLVADDGAKVRESLSARASTLRRRRLAEAEGDAQKADQSMRIAQVFLAFGFLLFIGYPAVINVLVL